MSEANMIIFPDVTFTPEQMAAVSQMATRLFDAEAQVAHLRAQLNAVPIAQLRRQYSIEQMTVHDFGLDAQDVDAWLRSLDGDA